jgi:pyridinium-3,5-bisthiocarboxylic acid mononucleotide nickel chelatase
MRILYFDTFSGISGDMTLGAFINAGMKIEELREELKKIPLEGYEITAKEIKRNAISATKFDVEITKHEHIHRHIGDIYNIIDNSGLNAQVKEKSKKIFSNIALAEAKVHNMPLEKVHFHEVGAVDSIIDIIGSAICIDKFKIDKIYSSPIKVGSGGFVKTQHGNLPLPAPATAELIKNYPVTIAALPYELTTPTGAAIITTLSSGIMKANNFKVEKTGYGAGGLEIPELPNLLRIFIGEAFEEYEQDEILLMETNIDDMNPQFYPIIMDEVFSKGALDAFLTPIIMKKGRPGILLSVIAPKEQYESIIEVIYTHSTSIGIRTQSIKREKLKREVKEFDTSMGKIKAKVIYFKDKKRIAPEFEDIKKLAIEKNISILEIQKMMENELNRAE